MLNTTEINNLNYKLNVTEKDFKTLDLIENKFFRLLSIDRNRDNPVFVSVNGDSVSKINYLLSGRHKKTIAIGIAGQTASGKSTFANDLIETINFLSPKKAVTVLNADNYYYDTSVEVQEAGGIANFIEHYDFDSPDAIELDLLRDHISVLKTGGSVRTPKYMMDGTATRHDNYFLSESSSVIVSEGLFNLSSLLSDAFDIKIFVNISSDIQKDRWFKRAAQRGFIGKEAEKMFNKSLKSGYEFIQSTAESADIIINGEASREDYKNVFKEIYSIFSEVAVPVL